MKEELAMHEDLCTSLELFNLATKCARAEEGRLSLLELPAADPRIARGLPCSRQNRTPSGARICLNPPGAAGTVCTTTSTPTTPMNAKNSAPCEKEESADALTVLTEATAEEEEGTRGAGKTAAHVQAGATNLARIAGATRLAKGTGGISLVRIAPTAT